jgi:hypothetical protein
MASVIAGASLPNFQCIRVDRRKTEFPVKAVALLKQSNVAGNMAVHFDWGEYVLWHLGPQIKVSIDGRRKPFTHGGHVRKTCFSRPAWVIGMES